MGFREDVGRVFLYREDSVTFFLRTEFVLFCFEGSYVYSGVGRKIKVSGGMRGSG